MLEILLAVWRFEFSLQIYKYDFCMARNVRFFLGAGYKEREISLLFYREKRGLSLFRIKLPFIQLNNEKYRIAGDESYRYIVPIINGKIFWRTIKPIGE